MALYDRPEELRERMARLIERFYAEHIGTRWPSGWPRCSAAWRRTARRRITDPSHNWLTRLIWLERPAAPAFTRPIFAPSLDMGVYSSCAIIGDIHGLFYPLEPEYRGAAAEEAEETRLARIYKALGDEQRLRILRMLREREMYAQEIVERTGLHQSVVSRHLVHEGGRAADARKQNNMKFYSLNPAAREMLTGTLALFEPAATR